MTENMSPKPLPIKNPSVENFINFPEAIKIIIKEGIVTKKEWDNIEYYLILKDGKLKIHKPDGKFYDLIVTDGDLFGEDWYKI